MAEETDHLRYWRKLANVPKEHLKDFNRAGGFRGTAVKPQWQLQKMTEVFGPVGIGWGMEKPEFTVQPAEHTPLVFCTVAVWYRPGSGTETSFVYGIGGDKLNSKRKDGTWEPDDEAFKKAYTDALGNAFKMIGMASDIHMGFYDGSKYVKKTEDPDAGTVEEGINEEPKTAYRARQDGTDKVYGEINRGLDQISERGTIEDLALFWKSNQARIADMPDGWKAELLAKKDLIKEAFNTGLTKPVPGDRSEFLDDLRASRNPYADQPGPEPYDPETGELQ